MGKQTVWRTVSKPDHNGIFIWEVLEFMSDEDTPIPSADTIDHFVKCRDGSYVLITCWHTFTKEHAESVMEYTGYDCQVIDI